jgi:hypothetical protein
MTAPSRCVGVHVAVCHQHHGHGRREALRDRAGREGGFGADATAGPEFKLADLLGHGLAVVVDGQLGTRHLVLASQGRQYAQRHGKIGIRSGFLAQKPGH